MAGTGLSLSCTTTGTDAGRFERLALWCKDPRRDRLQTESHLSEWPL
jgi:hypothetical protein